MQVKDTFLSKQLKINLARRLAELLTSSEKYGSTRKPFMIDIITFAEEIDCSPTMLRRYLRAEALPPFETIEKAAKALDVDALWLICGNNNQLDVKMLQEIFLKIRTELSNANSDEEYLSKVKFACDLYDNIQKVTADSYKDRDQLVKWMLEHTSY